MKLFKKISLAFVLVIAIVFVLTGPITASAAATPIMGATNTFGILASTYTNTAPGTTINGDLGYTTGPAVAATVTGGTHVADAIYNQAGIDQATALANLNSQPATFTFAPGAIDLASDTTHGPIGVYTPGVYVITGAADIGGGGTITLSGSGTYIFRMDGALNTSANSRVILADGASACEVFWTPTQATTLGANSTFAGTDIDASGIAIGDTVSWSGKALAFGGTVSTVRDTITVPDCTATEAAARAAADAAAAAAAAARLPRTGIGSEHNSSIPWNIIIPTVTIVTLFSFYLIRRKRAI